MWLHSYHGLDIVAYPSILVRIRTGTDDVRGCNRVAQAHPGLVRVARQLQGGWTGSAATARLLLYLSHSSLQQLAIPSVLVREHDGARR